MADKPITFSAPMVRALLAGTKTQTRRLVSKPEYYGCPTGDCPHSTQAECNAAMAGLVDEISRFRVGDRVYVREHWRVSDQWDETAPRDLKPRSLTIFCEAGGSIANQSNGKWEPDSAYPVQRPDWLGRHRQGMHMPRWASRMWLEITDVRVQRLRDISEKDCRAEGLERGAIGGQLPAYRGSPDLEWRVYADAAYGDLWNSLHTEPGTTWADNPWIVAYTFIVHQGNVDG